MCRPPPAVMGARLTFAPAHPHIPKMASRWFIANSISGRCAQREEGGYGQRALKRSARCRSVKSGPDMRCWTRCAIDAISAPSSCALR